MITIKHRFSGTTLFEFDVETVKLAVETAVKDGANLEGAKSGLANLREALKDAEANAYLDLKEQIATLTRQRDLAVNALESIAGRRMFIDSLASNVDIAVMTLDTIKESEK